MTTVCGTRSQYMKGCRCDRCRAVQREYMRHRTGSLIDVAEPVSAAVHRRALRRLAERHQAEFKELLEDEMGRGR